MDEGMLAGRLSFHQYGLYKSENKENPPEFSSIQLVPLLSYGRVMENSGLSCASLTTPLADDPRMR